MRLRRRHAGNDLDIRKELASGALCHRFPTLPVTSNAGRGTLSLQAASPVSVRANVHRFPGEESDRGLTFLRCRFNDIAWQNPEKLSEIHPLFHRLDNARYSVARRNDGRSESVGLVQAPRTVSVDRDEATPVMKKIPGLREPA